MMEVDPLAGYRQNGRFLRASRFFSKGTLKPNYFHRVGWSGKKFSQTRFLRPYTAPAHLPPRLAKVCHLGKLPKALVYNATDVGIGKESRADHGRVSGLIRLLL